jgi:hypothetical protein
MIFLLFIIAVVAIIWLVSASFKTGASVGADYVATQYQQQQQYVQPTSSQQGYIDGQWQFIENNIIRCAVKILSSECPLSLSGKDLVNWFRTESEKANQNHNLVRQQALSIAISELGDAVDNNFHFDSVRSLTGMRKNCRALTQKMRTNLPTRFNESELIAAYMSDCQ